MLKENEFIKPNETNPKLQKSAKGRYAIVVTGIFAIVVSHFLFQFFIIQNEDVRISEELVKSEKFDENKQLSELPKLNEATAKEDLSQTVEEVVEDETEPENSQIAVTKTKYKAKREVERKSRTISPPIQSRPKTSSLPKVTKKKMPQETRAERLRRAEKILTGA